MALAPVTLISLLFHGLIAWRLLPDLPPSVEIPLGGVLLLSALLVPKGLMGRGAQRGTWNAVLVWAGLLCMGWFSSLLVLTLLRDGVLFLAWGAQAVGLVLDLAAIRDRSALAVPVLAFLMTVLGFWNARRTAAVVRVDVPIAHLPTALQGFTMAQISDIHVGPTIKTHY
ncbi:MAG: metallophosphoesterase, partial [Burkholderiaceae bacterium]|nr:metallophosphoesterase [Burkholderiaceae bacterium]